MSLQSNCFSPEQYCLGDLLLCAFQGATVNINDVQFGSHLGRAFYPVARIETDPPKKSIAATEPFNYFKVAQIFRNSGTTTFLTEPQSYERTALGAYFGRSLDWMTFVNEALKDSRPMTDWERKVAAESFWSEFD